MKIKNEAGEEIEVFTAAELEERSKAVASEAAQKAVDAFKVTQEATMKELQDKLTAAESKVEDDEDMNEGQKKRLIAERDAARKKLDEWQGNMEKRITDIVDAGKNSVKDDMLDSFSRGDAELRKKLDFFNDQFKDTPTDKKAWTDRMTQVYLLATGNRATPSVLDGITGAGARGTYEATGTQNPGSKPVTTNEKAIGNVLGVTDADREKYRGKVRSSTAD